MPAPIPTPPSHLPQYGHRISEPEVGAIAVLTRGKRGGHVGVVSGVDEQGNPIIISGNHGQRVGEAIYPRSRVIAYVMPSGDRPVTDRRLPRAASRQPSRLQSSRAPSERTIEFADHRIAGGHRGRAEPLGAPSQHGAASADGVRRPRASEPRRMMPQRAGRRRYLRRAADGRRAAQPQAAPARSRCDRRRRNCVGAQQPRSAASQPARVARSRQLPTPPDCVTVAASIIASPVAISPPAITSA